VTVELDELVSAIKEQLHWLDEKEIGMFSSEALMLQRADLRVRRALEKFIISTEKTEAP
jgi:hypothetical protein